MTVKIFYNDFYKVKLKEGHRFPINKYESIRKKLILQNIIEEKNLYKAKVCQKEDLYLAHSHTYVDDVISLTLDSKKARAIGLPLSRDMVNRAMSSTDAVIQSAYSALENGFAASLCGGTHHASFDKGEGFCYFNDFAVVSRKLFLANPNIKILILDLDVHQGNGNSAILKNDNYVDIVSFHGRRNYPFKKIPSTIDVEFEDNTEDEEYLEKLNQTLKKLSQSYDLILYQAGVDSLIHDSLGNLNLSFQGLYQRDLTVFNYAKNLGIPISMALGGGYSKPIEHTIEAACNSYLAAKKVYEF